MPRIDNNRADRDDRLTSNNLGNARIDRESQERETTGERELSDAERTEMFRMTGWQEQLPNLPAIPGYHTCWLTTTNPRDPIHGRLRLGYRLIRAEEVPGFESASLTTGAYAGCIGINEMVAAKLPMQLYAAYMRDVHHDQPNAEEQRLNAMVDVIREEAAEKNLKIEEGSGTRELARQKQVRPLFEGVPT